jgi:hypothetical protein
MVLYSMVQLLFKIDFLVELGTAFCFLNENDILNTTSSH